MAGKGVNRSIRLFINGKEVEHSVNNVRKTMNNLRREINETTKGSEEYVRKSAELRKVTKYFEEMKREISGLPTFFDKLSEKSKGIVAIFGVGFGLDRMASGFRQLISLSAELADKQADVRKTTGMTKEEVRGLTQELDKLETRTSRSDLLSIAEEGGRIGIAKEDIAEFTEAMNKANVALGDVFGSAEEVASTLGKLRFLYKETAEMGVSDAYNKIGSALNELGANGVASEQNIAAFATRVGALPNAFKPSIAASMALGASFEESGVDAEVAGRSYGILVQTAANNTAAFAKQMNLTKAEVEELINRDPVEFFLKFTESFKGMDRSGVQMAKTLKDLGISADGVNKIIGAAANNNDRFRESIALSNQAMEEGTSLTDEYNVKNENLAATIEKINKTFVEWIDSDTVQDFIEGLVEWFGALIGSIDRTDEELNGWQRTLNFATKVIGSMIVVMISYKTISWVLVNATRENIKQTLLYQGVLKGKTAVMKLSQIAMMAYGVITKALTGQMRAARYEAIWLGHAIKALPWGMILSVGAAVISYFTLFNSKAKEAAESQKEFSQSIREAHKTATEETGKSIAKIDRLINVIKDQNASLENQKKAYNELIRIAPEFNGLLLDEKFNIEELTRVYKAYVLQLQNVARAKATKQIHDDTQTDAEKGRSEIYQIERDIADAKAELQKLKDEGKATRTTSVVSKTGNLSYFEENTQEASKLISEIYTLEKALSNLSETQLNLDKRATNSSDYLDSNRQRIQSEIDLQQAIIDGYSGKGKAFEGFVNTAKVQLKYLNAEMKALGFDFSTTDDSSPNNSPSSPDKKKEDPEPERRRKIAEELLKIEVSKNRKIRDEKLKNREEEIALMEDGFDKEWAKLGVEHEKRLNKLSDEKEDLLNLQKEYERRAEEERAKGNKAGQDGFKKQADEIKSIVKIKEEELLLIDKTFMLKYQTLKHEFDKKSVEDKQKTYERELRNLETFHLNQLQSITDLESAKEVLRNEYGFDDKQLSKLKNLEDAKKAITLEQSKITAEKQIEMFTSQISEFERLVNEELANRVNFGQALMSDEDLENLIEKLEIAKNALAKVMTPEEKEAADEEKKLMGFIDILGFSGDQWEEAFSNLDKMSGKLALVQMGVQALSNAWSQYHAIQQRNMQRDLDAFTASTNRKKDELKKQLDEGYISEATYNAKVAKMDAELEKKRAEMEYESAMSEWKASLLEGAVNTAVGITASLKLPWPKNLIMAGIVGSMGAIQLGMIAANKPSKPKGYFDGGESGGSGNYDEYGRELADGPLHAREYVIPEYLRRDPVIARMEEFIEARRRGMRPDNPNPQAGYADGGVARPATGISSPDDSSTAIPAELISTLIRLNENLENLQENPIEARLSRNLGVAKMLHDDIEDYKNHRNKNKR